MMKVLFSGFKDANHSASGGYDKITDMPVDKTTLLVDRYPLGRLDIGNHLIRIPLSLLDVETRLRRFRYDITHLFYGEISMLFFLPYLRSRKHKTVITLHHGPDKRRIPSLFVSLLRHFDGIVVLSSGMKKELKEKYGLESEFIPHGFYKPRFEHREVADRKGRRLDAEKINVITIGQMYRDYDTFEYIVERMKTRADLRFHLVGAPADVKERMRKYEEEEGNVSVYNRLPDDEFYSLISDCDYCFLPLTFATANNTLLEAQFLDVPAILPDIEGVLDYAAPAPMNYYYHDRRRLEEIFTSLSKSKKNGEIAGYMEKFDWKNVFVALEKYYNRLLNGK